MGNNANAHQENRQGGQVIGNILKSRIKMSASNGDDAQKKAYVNGMERGKPLPLPCMERGMPKSMSIYGCEPQLNRVKIEK